MNRKLTLTVITTALGFVLGYFIVQQLFFKPETFDQQLMQAANELNKSCPMKVDNETQLDSTIALPNNIFQYNYSLINMERELIDTLKFRNYLRPIIINNVVTNPDLKTFRDNDVLIAYNYNDMNGKFLLKLLITPQDYK